MGLFYKQIGSLNYEIEYSSSELPTPLEQFFERAHRHFSYPQCGVVIDHAPASIFLPFGSNTVDRLRGVKHRESYFLDVALPPGAFDLQGCGNGLAAFVQSHLGWSMQVTLFSGADQHLWCVCSNEQTVLKEVEPNVLNLLSNEGHEATLFCAYLLSYLDACHLLLAHKLTEREGKKNYAA